MVKLMATVFLVLTLMMFTGCNEVAERDPCTIVALLTLQIIDASSDADAVEGFCGYSACQDGVVDAICMRLGLDCDCSE